MPFNGLEVAFLWQHESGNKWITHTDSKQDVINNAFNKGQKTVTLPDKDPKKKVVLSFDKMLQKNKVSGWEQRIRCCVFDDGFFVWQWHDDDEQWRCYTPQVSLELEACFKQKKTVKFCSLENYEIDLKNFKQKSESTGTVTDVKREKVIIDEIPGMKKISAIFKVYMERKSDYSDLSDARPAKMIKLSSSDDEQIEVPVDEECTELAGKVHVFKDESGVYGAVLNQTNLQFNNNKYYLLQLLKDDTKDKYYVWYRWGRVGKKGDRKLIPFHSSLSMAKKEFQKKFQSKTSNSWEDRNHFVKAAGKYDLLKMEYKKKDEKMELQREAEKSVVVLSKLPELVQNLLKMISDRDVFTKQAAKMNFDLKKNPLGKLNAEQIRNGWLALKKIESILKKSGSGSQLVQACSDYYTRIPHDFGMKTPPIISSIPAVLEEMNLLQVLSDAEVAFKIKEDIRLNVGNPLDCLYESLKCELKPMSSQDDMFEVIEKYLQETHGPTHTAYKMSIINVFECIKSSEQNNFVDLGNKYLLWHGSRLTNFVGILKNGLQIAPPEAPSTGYMFGKGLYFADVSSKSANYCYPTKKQNEGLVLLCEVSLGEENILVSADYNADVDTKKKNKNSVKALGKYAPDPSKTLELSGVKVPLGKTVPVEESSSAYELNYNEYVIYNINQVKLRNLLHLRFDFF